MSAFEQILTKEKEQLYRKVGRKYVPINDPFAYDGLREGWWLVKVAPGSTSIRQMLHPAKAEVVAAAKDKEDQLVEIIRKASEARPKDALLSDEVRKDWEDLIAKHGNELSTIYYPSFQENAEKIIDALTSDYHG
jgi:hypothetical protein